MAAVPSRFIQVYMSILALGLDFWSRNPPRALLAARWILAAALLIGWNAAACLADPPRKAAVFDFELVDTSLEGEKRGPDPAEAARLIKVSEALRDGLAASGRFTIVSTTPAARQIADAGYIRSCNGCELAIARGLGADLAITGEVHKVSTLILSITIQVKDAATGAVVRTAVADIRGNTDESWLHGVRWLVRNRLTRD